MRPKLTQDDREALYICALERSTKWAKMWTAEMAKPEYKRDWLTPSYLRLSEKYRKLANKVLAK